MWAISPWGFSVSLAGRPIITNKLNFNVKDISLMGNKKSVMEIVRFAIFHRKLHCAASHHAMIAPLFEVQWKNWNISVAQLSVSDMTSGSGDHHSAGCLLLEPLLINFNSPLTRTNKPTRNHNNTHDDDDVLLKLKRVKIYYRRELSMLQ